MLSTKKLVLYWIIIVIILNAGYTVIHYRLLHRLYIGFPATIFYEFGVSDLEHHQFLFKNLIYDLVLYFLIFIMGRFIYRKLS